MADYVRPQDFTKGPPCLLCGYPNLRAGHNAAERAEIRGGPTWLPPSRNGVWHQTLRTLWGAG